MLSLCLALYGLVVSPVLDPKPLREVLSLPDGLRGHRLTVDVNSGSIIYATRTVVFRSHEMKNYYLSISRNLEKDKLVVVNSRDQGLLIDTKTWKLESRFRANLAAYNTKLGLVKILGGDEAPQKIQVGTKIRPLPYSQGGVLSLSPTGDYFLCELIGDGPTSVFSIYSVQAGGKVSRVTQFVGPYREGTAGSIVRVSENRFVLEYGGSFTGARVFILDIEKRRPHLKMIETRDTMNDHPLQQNKAGAVASITSGVFPRRSYVVQITPTSARNLGYFDSRFGFMVTPKGELFPYVPKERWSDEVEPSPGPQAPFTGKERRE